MPAGAFKNRRNLPCVISTRKKASARDRVLAPAIDEVEAEVVPETAFHRRADGELSVSAGAKEKKTAWRALKQWRRSLDLLREEDC
ncbi:hypothetical protein [Hyphococcus luteus]|uniref:Uncharacterized protein n=1 Tax=Hyphococcus luteus TaxID=2058213 RepID=A0A2S7KA38_9PROT|nr:hypothetical protein [Marinicaulis flavus]PQA89376.1 hypothetical protein CW354_00420 [Marinicaulis flavus]